MWPSEGTHSSTRSGHRLGLHEDFRGYFRFLILLFIINGQDTCTMAADGGQKTALRSQVSPSTMALGTELGCQACSESTL